MSNERTAVRLFESSYAPSSAKSGNLLHRHSVREDGASGGSDRRATSRRFPQRGFRCQGHSDFFCLDQNHSFAARLPAPGSRDRREGLVERNALFNRDFQFAGRSACAQPFDQSRIRLQHEVASADAPGSKRIFVRNVVRIQRHPSLADESDDA
jgi:hypothetical protein